MKNKPKILLAILFAFFATQTAYSQPTAFNLQGRINDGTSPANGRYDLQFKLFDALAGGNQVGAVLDRPNIQVVNGVFSTTLDWNATIFTGGSRFLEISVRQVNNPNPHVVLGSRQQILAVPYAIRAAAATTATNAVSAISAGTANDSQALGGVPANSYARLGSVNIGGLHITNDFVVVGNIRQSNGSYGAIKATLYVQPTSVTNAPIVRCYNATTNSSTPPCGFSVIAVPGLSGIYRVDLGFNIENHTASVSAQYGSGCSVVGGCGLGNNFGANFRQFNTSTIEVFTFAAGNSDDTIPAAFTLVLH
jgi:hypothetical protein